MKTFTTDAGKEIAVTPVKGSRYVQIQFTSGGELPNILKGLFTSEKLAYIAIEKYLNTKETKRGSSNRKKL